MPRSGSTSAGIWREMRLALLAVAAVGLVLVLGQMATYPNLASWYAGLIKPSFTPPDWLFGPVWAALYGLMAFASWRVLRLPGSRARTVALFLYALLLILNAAWSWMFFGARSPGLGLLNIVPHWLVILATIAAFARLDRTAAWCLAPLAGWVAYAGLLNFWIWRLNG